MADSKWKEDNATPFCGTREDPYPVFRSEIEFIRVRREMMCAANRAAHLEDYPTAENGLVGLCFSGGGIRSATFNLGLLQALYKHGILQRVDYLSTVSGGGYIGSCLTALLNSEFKNPAAVQQEADRHRDGQSSTGFLWDAKHFPFASPTQPVDCKDPISGKEDGACFVRPERESAEKEPARHLRYFSNYLTAEGNFVRKYLGPVLAITRGLLFNFLSIVPLVLMAAIVLASLYRVPSVNIKGVALNFSMQDLKSALVDQRNAELRYKEFVYFRTPGLGTAGISQRIPIIRANPDISYREKQLLNVRRLAHAKVMAQWKAMLTIPLAALFVMMGCAFFVMQFYGTARRRFTFSFVFSCILFASLVLFAIQVFGAAIVYWNHWKVPNMLALISVLTFLGPKLAKAGANSGQKKKPWIKMGLSILLMSLTPLILLYFTGWFVHYLLTPTPLGWPAMVLWGVGAIALLYVTNRWININRISLHNFYRDRLSRAYIIQSDSEPADPGSPFDRLNETDHIPLSGLYGGGYNVGPYPIINANLNLSKKMPEDHKRTGRENEDEHKRGVFRNCESFIFSKYWCGSRKTGYVGTAAYEKADKHIDLATAMAISGAAANIGMGQGNMPAMRLLMGLLNIRLGYWAPHPGRSYGWVSRWLLGKSPGGLQAMREWIASYSLNGDFINLSDGGHFDNLGVYELLRRRCKYIIVGDAEADPQMQFQALAYIIRLARIDFGVDIEIDTSSLKRDRENGLSHQHCTVGIIKYPQCPEGDAEEGYLLYCKSSLTGDEPEHLHEYRVKHPSFPHQTTADQWFDEQQFEVYRELGFHVGNTTFKPAFQIKTKAGMEDLFIRIKEFWQPRTLVSKNRFTQHARELSRILEIIKNDENLAFMDDQIFPEWRTFMSEASKKQAVNLWLPQNEKELRAGFYVCNLMIQLMENVYLDLNLESDYDHPDNRGWMNLFMHWAWSGIFQVSWAISACTFGAKFQKFCAARLELDIMGDIVLHRIWPADDAQPFLDCAAKHLNLFEVKEIEKHLSRHLRSPDQCYAFHLIVQSPLTQECAKAFCFGFALLIEAGNKVEIDYFRVQDHLRKMGLGRMALKALVSEIVKQKDAEKVPLKKRAALESIEMARWITTHKDEAVRKQFNSMLSSVIAAVGAEV